MRKVFAFWISTVKRSARPLAQTSYRYPLLRSHLTHQVTLPAVTNSPVPPACTQQRLPQPPTPTPARRLQAGHR